MVTTELGITAQLKTDPMTAVAICAAYYCESRQWDKANVSAPKPRQASAAAPEEPNLLFDYTARTPDDKTVITLNIKGALAAKRQLQITTKDWDSGKLPLADGLTISVPLKDMGEHKFNVRVFDEAG